VSRQLLGCGLGTFHDKPAEVSKGVSHLNLMFREIEMRLDLGATFAIVKASQLNRIPRLR
jgi:hypothetical protein